MKNDKVESDSDLYLQHYIMTFWLENTHEQTIKLFVEPWGEVYELMPGGFIKVVARGPKSGCPVLYCQGSDFVYSAWPQSVFAIYKDGVLLSAWNLEDCPPEPSPLPSLEKSAENLMIFKNI